jgi:hypothetical protein
MKMYVRELRETADELRYSGIPIVFPHREPVFKGGLVKKGPAQTFLVSVSTKNQQSTALPLEEYMRTYQPKIPSGLLEQVDRLTTRYETIRPEVKTFMQKYYEAPGRGAFRGAAKGAAAALLGIAAVEAAKRSKTARAIGRGIKNRAQEWKKQRHRRI